MFGTLLSNFEPVQSSKRRLAGQGGPRQTHAAAPFDHGPRDAELTPRGLNLPPLAKLQHPQQPSPLEPHTVPSAASDAACPRAVWRDHVDSGATEAMSPSEERAASARHALNTCRHHLRERLEAQRMDRQLADRREMAELNTLIRSYRLIEMAMEKEHDDWDPIEGAIDRRRRASTDPAAPRRCHPRPRRGVAPRAGARALPRRATERRSNHRRLIEAVRCDPRHDVVVLLLSPGPSSPSPRDADHESPPRPPPGGARARAS